MLGDFPLPRYGLSMTPIDHRCVVFGGYDSLGGLDEVLMMEIPGAALVRRVEGDFSGVSGGMSTYSSRTGRGQGLRSGPLSASAHSIIGGMPSLHQPKQQQRALGVSVSFSQ